MPDYDVIITGAGMVGATLACALAKRSPARIAVIESTPPGTDLHPSFDDRGITLSLSSRRILTVLGLWNDVVEKNARPVRHIHVTDRGNPGCVRFNARELGFDALGYVVIARELGKTLLSNLRMAEGVDVFCPYTVCSVANGRGQVEVICTQGEETRRLSARLLVVADGSQSALRSLLEITLQEKDYLQTAIVANVTVEKPQADTAYERFTDTGPLALLPLGGDRYVMVLTVPRQEAEKYTMLEDAALLRHLEERMGGRLGRFARVGKRRSYALRMIKPREQIRDRIVLLGDSAHALHPNGAQGLNLCLRDMAELTELLCGQLQSGGDPGSRGLLDRYLAARLPDQQWAIGFSDLLPWLFCNQQPVKVFLRNAGMILMDLFPSLQQAFVHRATGIHGRQPAMVRDIVI